MYGRNSFEDGVIRKLKRQKRKFAYEADVIPYKITTSGNYHPDLTIYDDEGKTIRFLELKGYFRPESKKKMLAVKQSNPHLDIRLVFQKYDAKNERWCKKHGFQFVVGEIDPEWFR